MDEGSAKIGTAIEHSKNNKYFVEFVEYQKKQIEKNPQAFEGISPEDDGLFLAYMTRRYFKDNVWFNISRIIAGMLCIVVSRIFIMRGIKPPFNIIAIGIFAVGVILVPLGIIILLSCISCLRKYNDYVTDRDDPFMDKVIKFYAK
jgi:hypothetical protein